VGGEKLTFRKNDVVLLDVCLEGVLLQLLDIRRSGNSRRSEQPEGVVVDVVHFDCCGAGEVEMISCLPFCLTRLCWMVEEAERSGSAGEAGAGWMGWDGMGGGATGGS